MKWGLGHSYDSVEFIPTKLRAYIDLTKPASSVGVAGGYFLASLFYFAYTGGGGWIAEAGTKLFSIIYVSLTIFFAHSASQAMNMAEDAEMDRQTPHKQNRPIPSGLVTEEEARTIAWILAAFALGRAYLVNWRFGVFATILVFMGVFYNLPPIRAKERIISIPWQAVSRGLLTFPAVWAAYGNPLALEAWTLGLFMFLYVLGYQNSADIIDREVDEEYGVRTFVVEFGVRDTVKISLYSMVAMVVVLLISLFTGVLEGELMSMLLIIPYCMYMSAEMWDHPQKVSETTGNHPAWLMYYGGMVLLVLIPLVSVAVSKA